MEIFKYTKKQNNVRHLHETITELHHYQYSANLHCLYPLLPPHLFWSQSQIADHLILEHFSMHFVGNFLKVLLWIELESLSRKWNGFQLSGRNNSKRCQPLSELPWKVVSSSLRRYSSQAWIILTSQRLHRGIQALDTWLDLISGSPLFFPRKETCDRWCWPATSYTLIYGFL